MENTIILLAFLILLSGFFSGTEIAFFSLGPARIRAMVRRKLLGARLVERLKSNPRKLLITILIGNNLVNIFAAAVATQFAIGLFGSRGIGIATGVLTFFILVFGEIFPKTIGQSHAERISRYVSPLVFLLEFVFIPLVWIMEKITGIFPAKDLTGDEKIVEEEIASLFQLGAEQGMIEWHEREFAERLFRFNDMPISAIMKPLNQAVMLDGDMPIENIIPLAADSGYSRFPVFRQNRERIVGIVHLKDIARANHSEKRDSPLYAIAKPPLFVSEEEKLDDAFRFMRKNRVHYVLVKNREGKKIVGTVTLEDVIEELVGEIYDESDIRKTGPAT